MVLHIAPMWYFLLSSVLFGVGIFGLLTQRSGIRILMSIELLLNAANVNFAAFGRMWAVSIQGAAPTGETFTLISIAVAAAEAAVGLAIFVLMFRLREGIDVDKADLLRW
ncbi:MAG: NADH-quinone oxidoreductase subunit NuoK [Thermoplasmatota archaeon]